MSDFGTELGNGGLSVMSKIMSALLKLFEKVFDTVKERTGADYKLKKAELNEMKDKAARLQLAEKMENTAGFVLHDKLVKAGVSLTSCGVTLDEQGMKELSARCKREGILISGVEDVRARELSGNKMFMLECKQSDLVRLANLIDLMNDEKKIGLIQEEIGKIENETAELSNELAALKGKEDLSTDESARISVLEDKIEENNRVVGELNAQIETIRYGHSQELNQEQSQSIVEKAVNGKTERGVSFDAALDRWTGGKIDANATTYVVDATNPDKYIVCKSEADTYKNQEYVKTTYEVYNANQCVYTTNDARFDGRPANYWSGEKAAMKNAGEFGDVVLKFNSVEEMEAYRTNYKEQNATELEGLNVGDTGRNYDEIIKTLEAKLEECGAEYKDGAVVDKNTGKPVALREGMSEEEKALVAEAAVVGKQINNYKDIKRLEGEVAIARTNVITTDDGTAEHSAAVSEFEKAEEQLKTALGQESALFEERKSVNAVQAQQEVIVSERNNINREERVDEVQEQGHAMSEYKGEIDSKRKNNQAKENPVGDVNARNAKHNSQIDRES